MNYDNFMDRYKDFPKAYGTREVIKREDLRVVMALIDRDMKKNPEWGGIKHVFCTNGMPCVQYENGECRHYDFWTSTAW